MIYVEHSSHKLRLDKATTFNVLKSKQDPKVVNCYDVKIIILQYRNAYVVQTY